MLDSAYLLLSQLENHTENLNGCQRYLWADSSPSRYHDWLWVEQHCLSNDSELKACFQASREIAQVLRAVDADPHDLEECTLQHLARLASNVKHHIHTPTALGSGKNLTDAVQKASAMAHSFALENPSWLQLHAFLDSFVSITTDLGTDSSF